MFSQLDGPTSLRADLVRALAFSLADVEQSEPDGTHLCRAAVAGIWNGTKGVVVVLLRRLDPARVTRYRFAHPVDNEADLDSAVESGLGFALSLGFLMDDPEFKRLDEVERTLRVARWDELRKVKHARREKKAKHDAPIELALAESPEPDEPDVPVAPLPAPEPPPPAAAAAPTDPASATAAAALDAAGKTVLARIALRVRGIDPLGRLLSFF